MSSDCGCQEDNEIVQYIEQSSCGCDEQQNQSQIEYIEEPVSSGCDAEQAIEYQLIEEQEPDVQYVQVLEEPRKVLLVDSSSIVQIYQSPVTVEPMKEVKSAKYYTTSPAPALKLVPDNTQVQIYQGPVTAGPLTEVGSGVLVQNAPKYVKQNSVVYYQSAVQADQIQDIQVRAQSRAKSRLALPTKSTAALPSVNSSCYVPSPVAPGVTTYKKVRLPTEHRLAETHDTDVETIVRENNNYTEFQKKVVTTVNRNHLHRQRVITNENNYNTYLTNKITKVNDIHRQRIENVPGETRVFNDYKESKVVETPKCLKAEDGNSLEPCDNQ